MDLSDWFKGFEKGIARLSSEQRAAFFSECSKNCVDGGVDFGAWLDGFEDTEKSVKGTVRAIMEHPLIPEDIMVRGFIIDSVTGELTKV